MNPHPCGRENNDILPCFIDPEGGAGHPDPVPAAGHHQPALLHQPQELQDAETRVPLPHCQCRTQVLPGTVYSYIYTVIQEVNNSAWLFSDFIMVL